MFEDNDLYNLDLDEPTPQPEPQPERETTPVANEPEPEPQPEPSLRAQRSNLTGEPEPATPSEPQGRQITEAQYEFLQKATQEAELKSVVNDIQKRNPDFNFELVAKELLSLSPTEQKMYYTPQGIELLWYQRIAPNLAHSGRVDVARNTAALDMDELTEKLKNGTQTMDEELQFYMNLK